jgi:hypothetical protein
MVRRFGKLCTLIGCLLTAVLSFGQNGGAFHRTQVRADDSLPGSTSKAATGPMYLHVLSTGQSVSAGYLATPVISPAQPYGNLSLSGGPGGYATPLIPLIETGGFETPSSGIANTLHALDTQGRPIVIGLHGVAGYPYDSLRKGTAMWDLAMLQVSTTKAEILRIDSTASYRPIGVTVVHGESDFFTHNTANYMGYLVEWQRDYQRDVSGIMGHTFYFPMYLSQMNVGWTPEMALVQYQAHKNYPRKIILIGPKYQYIHQSDHMHLQNAESKHLGEMFAKVINEVSLKGNIWNPLMPTAVIRTGNVITLDYHIPVGTLAIDTTTVVRRPNYGFEFLQTGGNNASITNVALINGNTQVQITLDSIPTGTDQKIRYACTCYHNGTNGLGWCGGSQDSTAVGGNIRDTDSLPSPAIGSSGIPLYDWGVAFEEPVVLPVVAVAESDALALTVYPNPTHTAFHVRLSESLASIQSLQLADLSGRVILNTGNPEGRFEASIRVEGVAPGLYLLIVKVEGRADGVVKVLVD